MLLHKLAASIRPCLVIFFLHEENSEIKDIQWRKSVQYPQRKQRKIKAKYAKVLLFSKSRLHNKLWPILCHSQRTYTSRDCCSIILDTFLFQVLWFAFLQNKNDHFQGWHTQNNVRFMIIVMVVFAWLWIDWSMGVPYRDGFRILSFIFGNNETFFIESLHANFLINSSKITNGMAGSSLCFHIFVLVLQLCYSTHKSIVVIVIIIIKS